jgi:hypothetical protein
MVFQHTYTDRKMKRKCREEEGEGSSSSRSLAKSQRREDVALDLNAALEARPWDLKAGMILEVNLRNFMCHEVMMLAVLPVKGLGLREQCCESRSKK